MTAHNVYRDGKLHVCDRLCDTCVFRPGNLMRLAPGRLAEMVAEAKASESAIICHSTIYRRGVDNAVCRGFFERHATQPLQVAERIGIVVFDEIGPNKDEATRGSRRLHS